jgi:hypothetical protein
MACELKTHWSLGSQAACTTAYSLRRTASHSDQNHPWLTRFIVRWFSRRVKLTDHRSAMESFAAFRILGIPT